MTLQQLRYFVAVVEYGSINAAAHGLYTSQSNISAAVQDLERELDIMVFNRSNRGVTPTVQGIELLSYARQVLEQVEMLETRYSKRDGTQARLAISTQHYAFSVRAFLDVVTSCGEQSYELTLRETTTRQVLDDVASFRSDLGILYTSGFNEHVLGRAFDDANLIFSPLFEAPVHVFVGETHPLAQNSLIALNELDSYPRCAFDQGTANSFYYAEEPLAQVPHARTVSVADRATLTSLLVESDGYTLSTGVLTPEMQGGIVSIPLDVDETMCVGCLTHRERTKSALVERYVDCLRAVVCKSPAVRSLF